MVPFQDSVKALIAPVGPPGGVLPPNNNAEVDVPSPAVLYLPVPKSFTSVQFVPFHSSVNAAEGPGDPPIHNAAVLVAPAPAVDP